MAINGDILKTALGFLGIKDIGAATDRPDTKINITFTRYGKPQEINLTVQEVIDCLQDSDSGSGKAPGSRDPIQAGG